MLIVACVKHVPDSTVETSLDESGLLERGVDDVLNELDENALEAAVSLAEENDGRVVALTMGPQDAVDAVRRALQMGADEAVHVCDERAAGSDVAATARVLAAAIRKIAADEPVAMVFTGMTALDSMTAMLAPALAQALEMPALTVAKEVSYDGERVRISRVSGRRTQVLSATLPAVISVTDQANEPRYPGVTQIRAARKKQVTTWDLDDLGLDAQAERIGYANSSVRVASAKSTPERAKGTVITDTGDGGERLAQYLVDNNLV